MRVFLMIFVLGCVAPLAGLALQTDSGSNLRLVIVPPWISGTALVAQSGARVVGPDSAPFAVLADTADVPTFKERAHALGAWLVLDGARITELCGWRP